MSVMIIVTKSSVSLLDIFGDFFAIRILGLRDSLDKLVKMGCKLSKDLRSKKPLSYKKLKKSSKSLVDQLRTDEVREVESHLPAQDEAIEHISNRVFSLDPVTERSSEKIDIVSESVVADHVMSSGSADSGNDPETSGKLIRESPKVKAPEAMFDDEVLLALAEADNDTRFREEQAFRAIMRSMSM